MTDATRERDMGYLGLLGNGSGHGDTSWLSEDGSGKSGQVGGDGDGYGFGSPGGGSSHFRIPMPPEVLKRAQL